MPDKYNFHKQTSYCCLFMIVCFFRSVKEVEKYIISARTVILISDEPNFHIDASLNIAVSEINKL